MFAVRGDAGVGRGETRGQPDGAPARSSKLDTLIGAAGGSVLGMAGADVGASRETQRRLRWVRLTAVVWLVAAVLWLRAVSYDGAGFVPLPSIDPFLLTIIRNLGRKPGRSRPGGSPPVASPAGFVGPSF